MKTPILIRPATPEEAARAEHRSNQVDRYGELDRRAQLAKPDEDEAAVLKTEIQSWYEDFPATQGPCAEGADYRIHLSPKRSERTFTDKRKAFKILQKRLGIDGLIALLSIPVGLLDGNLTDAEQKLCVVKEHTGYRNLSVVALEEVKKAA